ncbi:ROK family protein [Dactylosporangium sp. NPDC000521]|uniref:ROK family protein n=1 Tax=Dactylosporangium sp. NPDC000521 TaxID=3363975 RepID=UPI0036B65FE7
MTAVLAVDVGGTKFAAALVSSDGAIRDRLEMPLAGRDPTGVLRQLVTTLAGGGGVAAVGVGTAGPLDRGLGTVSPVNIPAWRDFPLTATLSSWVPGVPVTMAGDAQCVALGEWWRAPAGGSLQGSLLGIVVSTGIGGGLVIDGRPWLGTTGNAGHIGHITVDPSGAPCPCGATGCVETIASGPAMTRWALAHGWRPDLPPVPATRAPDAGGLDDGAAGPRGADAPIPDARALAEDARRGVPVAVAAFDRAAGALATALLTTAALCDIDRVVIGGGVAAAGDVLLTPIRRALAGRDGMAFLRRLRVEASTLGRDGGLYGAAALALGTLTVPA